MHGTHLIKHISDRATKTWHPDKLTAANDPVAWKAHFLATAKLMREEEGANKAEFDKVIKFYE